ncbi:ferredoxin [Lachnospiraceae bacterium KM106-2]|nr:ferredoxin [Lachnospiraceae bacterium KM106-2]
MRACVDQDLCIGCGLCAATEPEVFEMNAEGKAEGVQDTTEATKANVQEAIDSCPVGAIEER